MKDSCPELYLKKNKKYIIPIASIAVVCVFFLVAILSMYMTGEDILHKVAAGNSTLSELLVATYKSIPRIGEMYQRSAITHFSYMTTIGADLVMRLIDVVLCFVVILACSAVILGRRPRCKDMDSAVFLFSFIALVCYNSSEIFTMRFSYLHNYVPILVLVSMVLYILLRQKQASKGVLILDFLIAALCGMSNEIVPIALIIICGALLMFSNGYEKGKDARKRIVVVLLGLLLGLIYLFAGGSIFSRASGAYGAAYDYVSYFNIFSEPVYTTKRTIIHLIFNIRHLFLPLVVLALCVILQYQKGKKKLAARQATCLAFSILYIIGVSQMMLLDDIESRLLSPAYLGVVIGIGMSFLSYLKKLHKNNKKGVLIISIGLLVMASAAVADISVMRILEHKRYHGVFSEIQNTANESFCIPTQELERTSTSYLYGFKTFSPFESWTASYSTRIEIFNKSIYYAPSCYSDEK